jgi:hypothetical protein
MATRQISYQTFRSDAWLSLSHMPILSTRLPPITLHFAARRFPSFVTRPLLTLFALDLIAVVALTSPHPFLPAMSQSHLPAN